MIWQLHVTIEGQRGRIRGELGDPKSGCLQARTYSSAIRSLRDTAAGTGGGRRQHQPLTFIKDVGPATPQLAQAACSGEVLRSVLFEFVRSAEGGQEEILFAVRLHDATISGHRLTMPDVTGGKPLAEEIDLTYRRIEWEHRLAKTMAADEWA
jgi:type VI secretion system secreted protein Hcp